MPHLAGGGQSPARGEIFSFWPKEKSSNTSSSWRQVDISRGEAKVDRRCGEGYLLPIVLILV